MRFEKRTLKRPASVKRLAGVAVVGIAGLVLWWTGGWQLLWELFSDRERLQRVVESSGSLAPAVFVLLLVAQAVLAPLPAPAMAAAGGYLFGTAAGFFLTWVGALLGGTLSFGISRLFGRRFAARTSTSSGSTASWRNTGPS